MGRMHETKHLLDPSMAARWVVERAGRRTGTAALAGPSSSCTCKTQRYTAQHKTHVRTQGNTAAVGGEQYPESPLVHYAPPSCTWSERTGKECQCGLLLSFNIAACF